MESFKSSARATHSRSRRFFDHPSQLRGLPARATPSRASILCWLALLALLGSALAAVPALATGKSATLSGVVNINTATAEQLQLLPGVGRVRADAILEIRKERGGFTNVEDLTAVKGIGPSMLKRLRPHVALKGKTTARGASSASASGPHSAGSGKAQRRTKDKP